MNAPLAGLKVVELADILPRPWIDQTSANLGTKSSKWNPQGDDTRTCGRPYIDSEDDQSAAYFYSTNRKK
jgi:crotonobetainyl-CoA:carnitine CoA-transferase CaiB-like acyl-CoA transferase